MKAASLSALRWRQALTAQRRLKEIGIRKIPGSSDFGIVRLLSGDFTKTVLTAIVIALPVSYFMAKNWLDRFALRIDLEWWFFAGSGVLALVIAWFTVGLQTVKAARINLAKCTKGGVRGRDCRPMHCPSASSGTGYCPECGRLRQAQPAGSDGLSCEDILGGHHLLLFRRRGG